MHRTSQWLELLLNIRKTLDPENRLPALTKVSFRCRVPEVRTLKQYTIAHFHTIYNS